MKCTVLRLLQIWVDSWAAHLAIFWSDPAFGLKEIVVKDFFTTLHVVADGSMMLVGLLRVLQVSIH